MKHSLVLGFDRGGMAEDQNYDNSAESSYIQHLNLPSATNSRYTFGGLSSFGSTTIPLRTSFRRMRFRANEAEWPAAHTGTGIRFRSIDRICVVWNCPSESGPIKTGSPA